MKKDPVADSLAGVLTIANRQDRIQPVLRAYFGEGSDAQKHNERYLTTKAVAELAECCDKSVFRAEDRGILHAVRRSRRCIRWRESEVLKWISQGQATDGGAV